MADQSQGDALSPEILPDETPPQPEKAATKPDEKAEEPGASKTGEDTAAEGQTEDEPESEDEEKTEDDPAPPKGDASKHSISRLRRQRNRAERAREAAELDRDHWRRLALQGPKPAEQTTTTVTDDALKPPKASDFETEEEHQRALTRWEARQEAAKIVKTRETEWAERQREQHLAQRMSAARARLEEASTRYEDFEEVAFNPDAPVSEAMRDVMEDSEKFGDIAYYLGSHPEEAARIAQLSPAAAARAIGRIEGMFLNPPKPKTTTAPPPPNRVKERNAPTKDPNKMTYDEYKKWREAGNG